MTEKEGTARRAPTKEKEKKKIKKYWIPNQVWNDREERKRMTEKEKE